MTRTETLEKVYFLYTCRETKKKLLERWQSGLLRMFAKHK